MGFAFRLLHIERYSQSGAKPLLLLALLLLFAPVGWTLYTLLALDGFGDRSHQLTTVDPFLNVFSLVSIPPISQLIPRFNNKSNPVNNRVALE